jgi:hypothetical protein
VARRIDALNRKSGPLPHDFVDQCQCRLHST